MTSFNDLFNYIQQMLAADAGFFVGVGNGLFSAIATITVVWFGIKWALAGGMAMDRFSAMLMKLAFGFAMIHYYSSPLPMFGGNFSHLITGEGKYLADQLNGQSATNLYSALDGLMNGMPQPGFGGFAAMIAGWFQFIVMFIAVTVLEGALYVIIAWGYVAAAVCILLGPVFIPFFLVEELDWMFWGWLKALVQYSFYPVVANAVILVFGRLLTGYINSNSPPWDGPGSWALLAPMLIMMLAFTVGVLKVPSLVNEILTGRSGSSAVPSRLG